ncbi:DnaA regulatory inactivator Hda [Marinobacter sp. CHS3-4]|uniref:DnaA regulatory inactivator Hda n=1 Tax=Marinobacter sp. CHS3-4 TaxID=3045174 RepID=UPI0024B5F6A4|nr:DnaA regulatory inactivator Hda [Marinobacter sp. CHS3-4]MDI9246855.1 DnaA regulatory inactivator Hda [Marinobacter sp. CHS3-4]
MNEGQLALGIKLRDDARFDNFHGERNAAAAGRLRATVAPNSTAPTVLLCGDEDTGKSHLLQAVCHVAEQQQRSAICVSLEEFLPFGPEALEGMEAHSLVCLDDLDQVAGAGDWEEAVFHLYNRVSDQGGQLVISLSDLPSELPFLLPDLRSRLGHGLVIQLGVNRDDDRARILIARAEQRGLGMSDEVAAFILKRAPRKLVELLSVLDKLDDNSLKAQRRLTIPFVKSVMDW